MVHTERQGFAYSTSVGRKRSRDGEEGAPAPVRRSPPAAALQSSQLRAKATSEVDSTLAPPQPPTRSEVGSTSFDQPLFGAIPNQVGTAWQGATGAAFTAIDAARTGASALAPLARAGASAARRNANAITQGLAATGVNAAFGSTKTVEAAATALTRLVFEAVATPFGRHPMEGAALRTLIGDLITAAGAPPAERAARIRDVLGDHADAVLSVLESGDVEAMANTADLGEVARCAGVDRGPALLQCWAAIAPDAVKAAAGWTLKNALAYAPDSAFEAIASELNRAIESFDAGKFPLLQKLADPKEGVDLSDFPEEVADALPGVLERYFSNLTVEDKRKYVRAFLSLPPGAGEADQIAAVMHECGPGMQKLFQLAASRSKSPVLGAALESLYGNIKPMSIELVKSRISEELGRDWSEVFASIETEPLGAATVGQVHEATLPGGRSVVVKVLRPGLQDTLRAEFTQMRSAAEGNEYLRRFLLDLRESGTQELDLRREARNLAEGAKCYNRPELGIAAVGLELTVQPTPGLLVMEKAPGRKFTDMPSDAALAAAGSSKADCVELKTEVLMQFMEIWYRSLAFDTAAFMHADLHPGNMFFELRPDEDPPFKLTIIDFGSAEKLHKSEQNALWKMGAAISAQHYTGMGTDLATNAFLDGFEEFAGKMTEAQRGQMQAFVHETLATSDAHPIDKVEIILKKTAAFGIAVPLSALQMSRGHKFLEGIGKALNKQLDEVDPKGERTRFEPSKVYVGGTVKAYLPFGDEVYPALEAVGTGLGKLYEYRDFAYAALLLYAYSQMGGQPSA